MNCILCGAEGADERGLCPRCAQLSSSFTETLGPAAAATGPAQALPVTGLKFAPGDSFGGRYTIVEEVGAGGMGQVYKALDRTLGRTVALKLVRPGIAAQPDALQRFRRELALAQEVTHPNVCRVHDLGEVEAILYISMEYVDGQSLDDLIHSMGHLSARQTITLGRQMCAGLQAVHERAIIHRDLKPGNIMVDRAGHALVMDFGMAYQPGTEKLTAVGAVLGTLAYLSPEHARGYPTDARSDIYAVGIILYEMLTGRRPPGDGGPLPMALRDAAERCPPPSQFVPEVPPALDTIVLRCLEREPARRFASAQELERELTRAAEGLYSSLSQTSLPSAFAPPPRAHWRKIAARTAIALAILTLVPLAMIRCPTPAPTVAILPFAHEGPKDTAHMALMIPAAMGEVIRASPGARVTSQSTTAAFKPDEKPSDVARQLGVSYVVHGSVKITGNTVQATATLWDAKGQRLASSTQPAPVGDVFGAATRLGSDVLISLGGKPDRSRNTKAIAHYIEGQRYLEGWDVEQNYRGAEGAFRAAVSIDPALAEAYAGLALALDRRYSETHEPNLVDQALFAAEHAVQIAPSSPEARLALGAVLLTRGQSVQATQHFDTAQRLAPADDAVCREIGRAYAKLKRYDEAARFFQRAIDLKPYSWENYNQKGFFLQQQGRQGDARAAFHEVTKLRPQADTGYINEAMAYLWEGNFDAAEPLLVKALQINPSFQAHSNLGIVYYATERYHKAAHSFEAAIKVGVPQAESYSNLGDAYRRLRQTEDAVKAYDKAIDLMQGRVAINPSDKDLLVQLSMMLAGGGRCPEARRQAGEAVEKSAASPNAHYYAAVTYAICGDRKKSLREARLAVEGGAIADVKTNPDLAEIRDDPELKPLLGAQPSPRPGGS